MTGRQRSVTICERIGDIEIRKVEAPFNHYEVVRYHPNELYNRESEFIYDKDENVYKDSDGQFVTCSKDMFEYKELSLEIGYLLKDKDDGTYKFVSTDVRPFTLTNDEYSDLSTLVRRFFRIVNPGYYGDVEDFPDIYGISVNEARSRYGLPELDESLYSYNL